MLSIGMFTYSTKPRGSVVHATSLAEALTAAGHDVTVYALGKLGATFERPLRCRVAIIPAAEAPPSMDALIRQRIGEFTAGFAWRSMQHDVYHAQDCLAASALLACNGLSMRPIVRTVHHVERFESTYLTECQRRSILLADAVFSVSQFTRREVLNEFGRESTLVANGVDLGRFAEGPSRPCASRDRIDSLNNPVVVLSVGGIEPRKNMRRALAAFARVGAECPQVVWVIVGDHSLWDHSRYVAEFNADLARLPPATARRVVRVGTVSERELTELYRSSDILLCPSEREGFGLSVLEAMAAGLAVVVPGREPFTEYLNEDAARFVDSSSIESMAEALNALIVSPHLRRALGVLARTRAADFSWARSAEVHVQQYQGLRSSWKHTLQSSSSVEARQGSP